jgi:hypothetical protein
MASKGLGSDADTNRLSTIAVNTWKLPDISSLHNVIRTGIDFDRSDANLFSPRIPSTIGPQTKRGFARPEAVAGRPAAQFQKNGGAERDRTADPLLAKQVLSQLSYSPNLSIICQATKMVGPGRLELPTSRLSGVRSNHLSYGPILGQARTT